MDGRDLGKVESLNPRRSPNRMWEALVAAVLALGCVGALVAFSGDHGGGLNNRPNAVADTSTVGADAATLTLAGPIPIAAAPAPTAAAGSTAAPAPTAAAVSTVPAAPTANSSADSSAVSSAPAVEGVDVPDVRASAFAVFDTTNDRWLAASRADVAVAVGSVMKLLTAYVVLQAGDLDHVVTVPALHMDPAESAIGLYEGEQLPRDVLLRAMLVVSANDAARALALDVGGSTESFVQRMNAAADELGLTSTVAANPVGLDDAGAHSSARDVVTLASILMRDATFRDAVARTGATLHGQRFASTNPLLGSYEGADGVKTGHTTDAGYCLVGSATRDGRTLLVAVLGTPSEDERLAAASTLLDWGFEQL